MEQYKQGISTFHLSGGRYLDRDPDGAWALFSRIGYERLLTAFEVEVLEAKIRAERFPAPRRGVQDSERRLSHPFSG